MRTAVALLVLVLPGCAGFSGGEPARAAARLGETVVGEALRDDSGGFEPAQILEPGDLPLLERAEPTDVRAADASYQASAGDAPDAIESAPDSVEKATSASNPPRPDPGAGERASAEAIDFVLELAVMALLAVLGTAGFVVVRRRPVAALLVVMAAAIVTLALT